MTERERVVLSEYGAEVRELSHADAQGLMAAGGNALSVTPTMAPGQFEIRAGSHVGTVVTDRVEVIINPKIPLTNLFLLLEPTKVAVDLRSELVGFGAYNELTPAFAAFFARLVEHTLARGLRRDYVTVTEDLVALRGRVDMNTAMRRPVPTPLPCTFDEYSIDTPHNRILKAALLRLSRVPGIGHRNQGTLLHLLMRFGDVADQPPTSAVILRRGFTRLERHYEPAVRLACLVLDGGSLLHTFGDTTAGAFLVNMNKVFETFLEVRLSAALQGRMQVRGQHETWLDADKRVRMRPDLVFEQDSRATFVGDAKYKVTKDINGVDSDLYQLLAYATALGVPEGVLVYAQNDQAVDTREISVERAGKRLHVRRVDLSGNSTEIRRSIEELADWIASRADRVAPAMSLA